MILELDGRRRLIIHTNKAQTVERVRVEHHWTRVAFGIEKNHRDEVQRSYSSSNSLHSLTLEIPSMEENDLYEVLVVFLGDICSHLEIPSPTPAIAMKTFRKVCVDKAPAYISFDNQAQLLTDNQGKNIVASLPGVSSTCEFVL